MPPQEPPRSYAGGAAQLARDLEAIDARILSRGGELTREDLEELARIARVEAALWHLIHARMDVEAGELWAEVGRQLRPMWAVVGLVIAAAVVLLLLA